MVIYLDGDIMNNAMYMRMQMHMSFTMLVASFSETSER